jgi:hypothetical protein
LYIVVFAIIFKNLFGNDDVNKDYLSHYQVLTENGKFAYSERPVYLDDNCYKLEGSWNSLMMMNFSSFVGYSGARDGIYCGKLDYKFVKVVIE